jgi:hypothetical protein
MQLTGRLSPDLKTIANFRKDNGKGIRNVCCQFVLLCRATAAAKMTAALAILAARLECQNRVALLSKVQLVSAHPAKVEANAVDRTDGYEAVDFDLNPKKLGKRRIVSESLVCLTE